MPSGLTTKTSKSGYCPLIVSISLVKSTVSAVISDISGSDEGQISDVALTAAGIVVEPTDCVESVSVLFSTTTFFSSEFWEGTIALAELGTSLNSNDVAFSCSIFSDERCFLPRLI